MPSPNFQWSFNGSASLPSGVTAMTTVMWSSSNSTSETYSSTLQFSRLSQSHAGMYTCQLGPGRLVNNVWIQVNGIKIVVMCIIDLWFEFQFVFLPAPNIYIQITTSGASVLGQSYSLICSVTGAENLDSSIIYQWTKNNGTQTQVPNGPDPKTLSFLTLGFSDAGQYTCQATVISPYLIDVITGMDTHDIRIKSKFGCVLTVQS